MTWNQSICHFRNWKKLNKFHRGTWEGNTYWFSVSFSGKLGSLIWTLFCRLGGWLIRTWFGHNRFLHLEQMDNLRKFVSNRFHHIFQFGRWGSGLKLIIGRSGCPGFSFMGRLRIGSRQTPSHSHLQRFELLSNPHKFLIRPRRCHRRQVRGRTRAGAELLQAIWVTASTSILGNGRCFWFVSCMIHWYMIVHIFTCEYFAFIWFLL